MLPLSRLDVAFCNFSQCSTRSFSTCTFSPKWVLCKFDFCSFVPGEGNESFHKMRVPWRVGTGNRTRASIGTRPMEPNESNQSWVALLYSGHLQNRILSLVSIKIDKYSSSVKYAQLLNTKRNPYWNLTTGYTLHRRTVCLPLLITEN